MKLTFDFNHSVDNVFEKLTDPDFLVDRSLAIGELSAECEVEKGDDGSIGITMEREVQRDIPKFIEKLIGTTQTLHITEQWQDNGDTKSGNYTIKVQGQPIKIMAELTLSPTKKGSQYALNLKSKVSIPLVGGKIEKIALKQSADSINDEMAYLKTQLG